MIIFLIYFSGIIATILLGKVLQKPMITPPPLEIAFILSLISWIGFVVMLLTAITIELEDNNKLGSLTNKFKQWYEKE